jgi:hypothetical protein
MTGAGAAAGVGVAAGAAGVGGAGVAGSAASTRLPHTSAATAIDRVATIRDMGWPV